MILTDVAKRPKRDKLETSGKSLFLASSVHRLCVTTEPEHGQLRK